MRTDQSIGMRRIKRMMMYQAFLLLAQWFTLWFGFGVEPKRIWWLAVYMLVMSIIFPLSGYWIYKVKGDK